LTTLVVDAHPAAPFTAELFEGSPEGFTEILHYGLSAQHVARSREGAEGMWIPAGAPWSLPLETPEEPERSLRRLAETADRVLLLAGAADEEGLLEAMRAAAHYRLLLTEAAVEEPALEEFTHAASAPGAGDVGDSEDVGDQGEGPSEFSLNKERGRGRRRRLLLPAVLVVAVLAVLGWRWLGPAGSDRVAEGEDRPGRDSVSAFSPLPERADRPYHSGRSGGAEDDLAPASSALDAGVAVAGTPPGEVLPVSDDATREAPGSAEPALPPAERQVPETQVLPPGAEQSAEMDRSSTPPPEPVDPGRGSWRRHESRRRWRSVLDRKGGFLVHVESYRDSALAAWSARERGFSAPGFVLRPVYVKGDTWYRLCVGPFPDLVSACAYRDSLLDQAGVDYCVIAVN